MMPIPASMETSCGFVLVNFDSILLLQYPQGHWSYPKGHVEGDEDHYQTARRELEEETGISEVEIDSEWSHRTEYTFQSKGRPIYKQVFWYIASTDQLEVNEPSVCSCCAKCLWRSKAVALHMAVLDDLLPGF